MGTVSFLIKTGYLKFIRSFDLVKGKLWDLFNLGLYRETITRCLLNILSWKLNSTTVFHVPSVYLSLRARVLLLKKTISFITKQILLIARVNYVSGIQNKFMPLYDWNKFRERRQLSFVTLNINLAVNLKTAHPPLLNGRGQFTFLKTKWSHSSDIVVYPPKFEFLRN